MVECNRFFCVNCGHEVYSIPRQKGRQRENGHLKRLWCPHCKEEHNCAEIREFGKYTLEDFRAEFALGRFVDDKRVPISELVTCDRICPFNQNGRCWDAKNGKECNKRISNNGRHIR